ncbi:SH3 domain-containing protein [Streptomyces sp. NPDC102467]|uniref:SH3 domain-containing protein n=1 Tax=Streptomyces sp. NPDC102467 TaxID=3366179 RepID=UPI0037F9F409
MTVEDITGAAEPAGPTATEATAATQTVATTETMAAATGSYAVAPGYTVNVRSGPGTQYRVVRRLPQGARVTINCQKPGQSVTGPYGTTKLWDNIGVGEYVSDSYVHTGSDGYVAPRCA